MKVQAVIWDFDGVILDNELLQIEVELETAHSFGLPLTREIALEYLGVKLEEYFRELLLRFDSGTNRDGTPSENPGDHSAELLGKHFGERLADMLARHYETLRRFYREVFPLSPHLFEVLGRLKPVYPMGIATNREREFVLLSFERYQLAQYFRTVVCKDDVKKGKPDPEPLLRAAESLGVKPGSAAVVEDSATGFRAAKSAGMILIARRAAHNLHLDFAPADFVVEDLREILHIVGAQI